MGEQTPQERPADTWVSILLLVGMNAVLLESCSKTFCFNSQMSAPAWALRLLVLAFLACLLVKRAKSLTSSVLPTELAAACVAVASTGAVFRSGERLIHSYGVPLGATRLDVAMVWAGFWIALVVLFAMLRVLPDNWRWECQRSGLAALTATLAAFAVQHFSMNAASWPRGLGPWDLPSPGQWCSVSAGLIAGLALLFAAVSVLPPFLRAILEARRAADRALAEHHARDAARHFAAVEPDVRARLDASDRLRGYYWWGAGQMNFWALLREQQLVVCLAALFVLRDTHAFAKWLPERSWAVLLIPVALFGAHLRRCHTPLSWVLQLSTLAFLLHGDHNDPKERLLLYVPFLLLGLMELIRRGCGYLVVVSQDCAWLYRIAGNGVPHFERAGVLPPEIVIGAAPYCSLGQFGIPPGPVRVLGVKSRAIAREVVPAFMILASCCWLVNMPISRNYSEPSRGYRWEWAKDLDPLLRKSEAQLLRHPEAPGAISHLAVVQCVQGRFADAERTVDRIRTERINARDLQELRAQIREVRTAAGDARIRYRAHPVPDASERAYVAYEVASRLARLNARFPWSVLPAVPGLRAACRLSPNYLAAHRSLGVACWLMARHLGNPAKGENAPEWFVKMYETYDRASVDAFRRCFELCTVNGALDATGQYIAVALFGRMMLPHLEEHRALLAEFVRRWGLDWLRKRPVNERYNFAQTLVDFEMFAEARQVLTLLPPHVSKTELPIHITDYEAQRERLQSQVDSQMVLKPSWGMSQEPDIYHDLVGIESVRKRSG